MLATYYSLWVWFFLLINLFKLEVNYFTIFSAFYHTFQRRQWHPTPVLLPGKSHGWKSLVGCSTGSHKELDTTKQIHFHTSLSCFVEGNGNPLQCSCLENPRDRESWWAAVYEVTQSWTRLKWLSSSSSSHTLTWISHGCTSVPILKSPPTSFPSHPSGCPSALALSALFHTLNLDWWSLSHMVIYMFQCYSLK